MRRTFVAHRLHRRRCREMQEGWHCRHRPGSSRINLAGVHSSPVPSSFGVLCQQKECPHFVKTPTQRAENEFLSGRKGKAKKRFIHYRSGHCRTTPRSCASRGPSRLRAPAPIPRWPFLLNDVVTVHERKRTKERR